MMQEMMQEQGVPGPPRSWAPSTSIFGFFILAKCVSCALTTASHLEAASLNGAVPHGSVRRYSKKSEVLKPNLVNNAPVVISVAINMGVP